MKQLLSSWRSEWQKGTAAIWKETTATTTDLLSTPNQGQIAQMDIMTGWLLENLSVGHENLNLELISHSKCSSAALEISSDFGQL